MHNSSNLQLEQRLSEHVHVYTTCTQIYVSHTLPSSSPPPQPLPPPGSVSIPWPILIQSLFQCLQWVTDSLAEIVGHQCVFLGEKALQKPRQRFPEGEREDQTSVWCVCVCTHVLQLCQAHWHVHKHQNNTCLASFHGKTHTPVYVMAGAVIIKTCRNYM